MEFLGQLRDYQLLTKKSEPWRWIEAISLDDARVDTVLLALRNQN
jgi:hypothetical protein